MECCKWSLQNHLIVQKTGPERLQMDWTERTKVEINSCRYSVVTWHEHSVFFTRKNYTFSEFSSARVRVSDL